MWSLFSPRFTHASDGDYMGHARPASSASKARSVCLFWSVVLRGTTGKGRKVWWEEVQGVVQPRAGGESRLF